MAKLGRNDPCPCGSAKKYKQCCLSAVKPPTLLDRLPEVIQDERLKAEQIARRWLGEDDDPEPGQAYPMRDAQGRKLILVLDRFSVADPEAVRQVRALGRCDEERVLFFDGPQWIGEADFSVAGELLLVTPQKVFSDRLLALLQPIAGLEHKERQVDELAALDHAPPTGGTGLLDFKKSFFAAWLDEPNEKLDGATPREAAVSGLRPRLFRLLTELEKKESKLPKSERFSFAPIRSKLGL